MAEDQLAFIFADLHRYTSAEVRALALDVQANLQEDTPRDTGWARANWVMSLGSPFVDVSAAETKDPTPADVAAAAAKQQASIGELAAYDVDQGLIFTTNNVPYIGALNEGHSPQQARPGFVQRSVADALNFHSVTRGGRR